MLKVLFRNAIRSPSPRKLLALCFIVYFASISFVVATFLLLLAAGWLVAAMKKKAKAILAAEAEAADIEAEKLAARAAADAKTPAAPVATAAANDSNAQPAPMKQYAKSAVVIPFKTGTR